MKSADDYSLEASTSGPPPVRGSQQLETEQAGPPAHEIGSAATILADLPWRFTHRTGKSSPEHGRLRRYGTLSLEDLATIPIAASVREQAHLYLWVPNALLPQGLYLMEAWGFSYKSQIVWEKTTRDGEPDGRGMGFYFRNATEALLFGTRGGLRTLTPARRQVNVVRARRTEHSRKPDDVYDLVQRCSPGPYLELFARQRADGWRSWGDETDRYPSAAQRQRLQPTLGI